MAGERKRISKSTCVTTIVLPVVKALTKILQLIVLVAKTFVMSSVKVWISGLSKADAAEDVLDYFYEIGNDTKYGRQFKVTKL